MIEQENNEHNLLVQSVLDRDGELPGQEYNSIANALRKSKDKFLKGNNTERGLLKRQVNIWSQNVLAYKNFRQDLAAAYNTKALMNTWTNSNDGKAVMALLRDTPRLVENVCPDDEHCAHKGELGVMMPNFRTLKQTEDTIVNLDEEYNQATDEVRSLYKNLYTEERNKLLNIANNNAQEWVSISNLKSLIQLKDNESKDAIRVMANNYISQSTQVNPLDNIKFNRNAAERQVRANIIEKATNIKSLAYDGMLDDSGENFKERFRDQIFTSIQNGEIPGSTEEDAETITEEIINNKEHIGVFKDELVKYYTNFMEKQWNMGAKNRPNPTEKENNNKPIAYKPGAITNSVKRA